MPPGPPPATFEAKPPTGDAFDTANPPGQRLVAADPTGRVLGWTAASGVSDRCVYAGVVEHFVYVDPAAQGHGIGRLLLDALIASTEEAGIWTIQSGIFPHQRVGPVADIREPTRRSSPYGERPACSSSSDSSRIVDPEAVLLGLAAALIAYRAAGSSHSGGTTSSRTTRLTRGDTLRNITMCASLLGNDPILTSASPAWIPRRRFSSQSEGE